MNPLAHANILPRQTPSWFEARNATYLPSAIKVLASDCFLYILKPATLHMYTVSSCGLPFNAVPCPFWVPISHCTYLICTLVAGENTYILLKQYTKNAVYWSSRATRWDFPCFVTNSRLQSNIGSFTYDWVQQAQVAFLQSVSFIEMSCKASVSIRFCIKVRTAIQSSMLKHCNRYSA